MRFIDPAYPSNTVLLLRYLRNFVCRNSFDFPQLAPFEYRRGYGVKLQMGGVHTARLKSGQLLLSRNIIDNRAPTAGSHVGSRSQCHAKSTIPTNSSGRPVNKMAPLPELQNQIRRT